MGVVQKKLGIDIEDIIILMVKWENIESGNLGILIYMVLWIVFKFDVYF